MSKNDCLFHDSERRGVGDGLGDWAVFAVEAGGSGCWSDAASRPAAQGGCCEQMGHRTLAADGWCWLTKVSHFAPTEIRPHEVDGLQSNSQITRQGGYMATDAMVGKGFAQSWEELLVSIGVDVHKILERPVLGREHAQIFAVGFLTYRALKNSYDLFFGFASGVDVHCSWGIFAGGHFNWSQTERIRDWCML